MEDPTHVPDPQASADEATGRAKADRYYQNDSLRGHEMPLGDELSAKVRGRLKLVGACGSALALGVLLGYCLAPESQKATEQRLEQVEQALMDRQAHIATLEQQLHMSVNIAGGKLKKADRLRHEREGRRYAKSLKHTGAQAAGNLIMWFVRRWNELLDAPQADDRATRRAATLALLVGGMAANINPGDYVPWQAEFLGGNWLGELHFDLDGDGLPGHRADANRHDGFANVSVCQVAMALNQSMRDAQVLVMPELHCDRPEARMSVFLQGQTLNDALDEFVSAVKAHGFVVVEKHNGAMRLVLVGVKPKASEEDDDDDS